MMIVLFLFCNISYCCSPICTASIFSILYIQYSFFLVLTPTSSAPWYSSQWIPLLTLCLMLLVLRYHPLRCIIIIIRAAVFVADDMFEVSLLSDWLQYFYHRLVGVCSPTTMCIRMVWLTMDAEGEEIVVSLCDEVLDLSWCSYYIIIISWGCMLYDGYPSPSYLLVHGP